MELSDNLRYAMDAQWDMIGMDCLQGIKDMTGTVNPTMSKEEVIEMVLDASRLEMAAEFNPELLSEIKEFRELGYEEQKKLAGEVFTFELYGY